MLSTLLALQLLASPQAPPPLVSDAPAPPPAAKPPQAVTWYGLQTIISDGSAVLLTGTGFVLLNALTNDGPGNVFTVAGIGLFFLGSTTVHLVHGNVLGALLSLGLRLVELCSFAAAGAVLAFVRNSTSPYGDIEIAVIVGQLLAGAIDATRFAFEPTPTSLLPGFSASSLRLAPFAGSVRGAPVAGLAGVF